MSKYHSKRRIFCCLIMIFIVFATFFSQAYAVTELTQEEKEEFARNMERLTVNDKFETKIVINEDKTMNVYDDIDIDFGMPTHYFPMIGIPLETDISTTYKGKTFTQSGFHAVRSVDASKGWYSEEMTGEKSKKTYTAFHFSGSEEWLTGIHTLNLSYRYVFNRDKEKGDRRDYIGFYLTPERINKGVKNLSAEIIFPSTVKHENIHISHVDKKNKEKINKEIYDKDGKTYVKLNVKDYGPNKGIEVMATMRKGYFTKPFEAESTFTQKWVFFSLILLMIILTLRLIVTKPKKMITPVEFYPPDNMTPLEIGGLLKIHKRPNRMSRVVSASIIYLANKGFVKINNSNSNHLIVTRINEDEEYTLRSTYRRILENIFIEGDTVDLNDIPCGSWMNMFNDNNAYMEDYNNRHIGIDGKYVGGLIFQSALLFGFGIFMNVLAKNTMFLPKDTSYCILEIYALLVILYVFLINMFLTRNWRIYKKSFVGDVIGSVGITLVMIKPFYDFAKLLPADNNDRYLVILIFLITIATFVISSRTLIYDEETLETRGKLIGFKNFLENAEKDKLEKLVNDNPDYFFNILPYTYLLDVDNTWIQNIDMTIDRSPLWCTADENEEIKPVLNYLNSVDNSVSMQMGINVPEMKTPKNINNQ